MDSYQEEKDKKGESTRHEGIVKGGRKQFKKSPTQEGGKRGRKGLRCSGGGLEKGGTGEGNTLLK